MTGSKLAALSIASVLCLALAVPAISFASTPAAANHAGNDSVESYVATQDDRCIELQTLGDGTEPVEEFYDYQNDSSGSWSSQGTKEYQKSGVSQLFVYHGENGVSLVFLHDKEGEWHNRGGAVTMNFENLPDDGEWAVQDDSYGEDTDDRWQIDQADQVDWMWGSVWGTRTDGGAFLGLDYLSEGESLAIDPAFGEESWASTSENWDYAENDTAWQARYGEGNDALASLDKSQSLSIERRDGDCDPTPPNAGVEVTQDGEVVSGVTQSGESVTVSAAPSYDEGSIAAYNWDLDGDDEFERADAGQTVTTEFDETTTVAVQVVDDTNETDTASTDVTVDDTPPEPDVQPNVSSRTVAVNEPIDFEAGSTSDDVGLYQLDWKLDDGTNYATYPWRNSNITHAYSEPGEYDVNLTAIDEAGNRQSTEVAITVTDDTDPTAVIEPTSDTTVGSTVEFNGSASDDNVGIERYDWTFENGDVTINETGETVDVTFDEPGDYDVTLNVTDADGNFATATDEITISSESEPLASFTGPEEVEPGTEAEFDASNSTNADSFTWELGDGTTKTGEVIAHTYDERDEYDVELTVTGPNGQTDNVTKPVHVRPNSSITASATADPGTVEEGEEVTFDASGSESSLNVSSYEWELGDGTTKTGETVTHTYDSANSDGYTVTLTVTDETGAEETDTVSVTVEKKETSTTPTPDPDPSPSPSPSPSPAPEPDDGESDDEAEDPSPSATAERTDDGAIAVTVENATGGESVSADVPADENASVELREIDLVPADDADRLTVTLVPDTDVTAPDGTDAGLFELTPRNETAVENVTYRFAVDRAAVNGSPDRLRVLAGNGSDWDVLDHTVVENDSTMLVDATTDVLGPVTVATERPEDVENSAGSDNESTPDGSPAIELTDVTLDRQQISPGEPVSIVATFENTGERAGTARANFSVVGDVVENERVSVGPGEQATVSFEQSIDSQGEYAVGVNGEQRTVTVGESGESTNATTPTPTPSDDGNGTQLALAGLGVLVIGIAAFSRLL